MARADLGLEPENLQRPTDVELRLPLGYILPNFAAYRKWGVYPHGGGYDSANADVIEDFKSLSYLLNYQIQQLRPKGK